MRKQLESELESPLTMKDRERGHSNLKEYLPVWREDRRVLGGHSSHSTCLQMFFRLLRYDHQPSFERALQCPRPA